MPEDGIAQLKRVMEAGFATLADLQRETNERLDETNERLGRVELRLERVEVGLERLGGRFDHFLGTAGGESRKLREDLDALTVRVERLERG